MRTIVIMCGCSAIIRVIEVNNGESSGREERPALCAQCLIPDASGYIGNYTGSSHWKESDTPRGPNINKYRRRFAKVCTTGDSDNENVFHLKKRNEKGRRRSHNWR